MPPPCHPPRARPSDRPPTGPPARPRALRPAVSRCAHSYGHVLSPEFKTLRRSGQLDAVRGEVLRLEPGKAVVALPPKAGGGCCGPAGAGKGGAALTAQGGDSGAKGNGYAELADETRELACDLIVCATGFGKSYSHFSPAVQVRAAPRAPLAAAPGQSRAPSLSRALGRCPFALALPLASLHLGLGAPGERRRAGPKHRRAHLPRDCSLLALV